MSDDKIKMSLEIKDLENSDFSFRTVMVGLTPERGGDGEISELVRVVAQGGWETSSDGALAVAALFRDLSDAIMLQVAVAREESERVLKRTQELFPDGLGEPVAVLHGVRGPDGVDIQKLQEDAEHRAKHAAMVEEGRDGRSRMPFNPRPVGPSATPGKEQR